METNKNNYLKNLLLAIASILLLLFSCEKKDDLQDTDQSNNQVGTYIIGAGVTDFEGNTYKTIIVTTSKLKSSTEQEWMAENLKATKYSDGSVIPKLQMAVCNNDSATIEKLGYLYTWDALMNNSTTAGAQGACPNGWHVPTVEEYNVLINALGGLAVAGKKMKAVDSDYWNTIETADNSSGFSALGGGFYMSPGFYQGYKNTAKFWTSTAEGDYASEVQIDASKEGMFNSYGSSKSSVRSSCRCIKD